MNSGKRSRGAVVLATVAMVAAASGCSNKAEDSSSSSGGGDAGEVTPTDEQLEKLKKRTQFEKELTDLQTARDAASAKQ